MIKIQSIKKKARTNEFFWRYGFNFRPTVGYRVSGRKTVDSGVGAVIAELAENGFAKTTISDFFGEPELAAKLQMSLAELNEAREAELRSKAAMSDDLSLVGKKTYSVELLGSNVVFDGNSVLAKLALNERILAVANAYLGMYARLRYYNFWHTLPTTTAARESQLWHFDREDNYILKVFVYLTDVDEGAGPFTYAPGTHRKGKFNGLRPEQFNEQGVLRSTDEQMAAVFPREKWIRATGQAGTVIFADTRGFHKGGEARTSERILFTSMYTSPASQSRRLLEVPPDADLASLSPLQRRALPA